MRRAIAWFSAVGVIGALIMFVLAPWLTTQLLKIPLTMQSTAVAVIRLSAVNFFLGMLLSLVSAVPQAFHRFDIYAWFNGIWGTAASVGPAVVVSMNHGLVAIVTYSLLLNTVALAAYALVSARLFRGLATDVGPPWKEVRRQVLSFAGITAVSRIHGTIAQQTTKIVVGVASGTAAAAYYQVPSVILTGLTSVMNQVAQALFPAASRLLARDEHGRVQDLYFRASRLFFLGNASVVTGSGLCLSTSEIRGELELPASVNRPHAIWCDSPRELLNHGCIVLESLRGAP